MNCQWPKGYTPRDDLSHAYNVGKSKLRYCVKIYHSNNFSTQRKKRSDAGLTIFNSEKKHELVFTPLSYWKKAQRKRHRETISDSTLKKAFDELSPEKKHEC